ncbi:hypothetical protein EAH68_05285 [Corynebacterium hylobatis]|uniref:Uncharacterized protein n=1 Tax=Corynebacterium hylobatis TaxID=1859290 RepID=A0A430HZQ5_9CORY|nr:hypothetical protein [Corynebacterium hylobatis]RSZ64407.1 hypothetical protein EAH68_05285 [Corynebacterium hylobatis]
MAHTPPSHPEHTPYDSLAYLARVVNGLLDLADDEIHGVHTGTITNTDDLPEHLADAVESIEIAARIIRYEATVHGVYQRSVYSTGIPTTTIRQEPCREPQDDGTTRPVLHDMTCDLYPDGHQTHPLFRPAEHLPK